MSEIEEKLENWFPMVNRKTWQILRLLEERPLHMRELKEAGFTGSRSTIQKYVDRFEKFGFVKTKVAKSWPHKRMVELTDDGKKALEHIDALGELVKRGKEKIHFLNRKVY